MKKGTKLFLWILLALFLVLLVGFGIFIYIHGNTKPYSVPEDVHEAVVSQRVDKGAGEVRVMSSNLLVYYKSWHGSSSEKIRKTDARPRYKIYEDVLKTYKPDVVGLQEVCDRWYHCLMRNKLQYKFVQPVKTAFHVRLTNLMYNADTTELLECGDMAYTEKDNPRLRCIVSGLFRDKATGQEYIVTSTHLNLIREDQEATLKIMQAQRDEFLKASECLKEKYGVPIYHTGDYNAVNNIENWTELYETSTPEELAEYEKNETYYRNAQAPSIYTDIAAVLPDAKGMAKNYSFAGTTTVETPTYDHIFVNGTTEIERYVAISDPKLMQMSDHYSIFIDAKADA